MEKRVKRSDIIIDLTSLLDVIFIVLLIVMCNQALLSETAAEKYGEAEAAIAEAEQAAEEARMTEELFLQHGEKYEEVDQYVLFIDVSSKIRNPNNVKKRSVMVITGSADTSETILKLDLDETDSGEQFVKLKESLKSVIEEYNKGDAERPVILSLNKNDDDILYRDEKAILAVFDELKAEYSELYVVE